MRARFFSLLCLAFFVFCLPGASPARAEEGTSQPEKVFRLAVVQANPYWNFTLTLGYVREYLREAGWGERATFPEELFFTWGDEGAPQEFYQQRAREILARDDYDLILSFGTLATRVLLEENEQGRPMVGLSISNPLASEIVPGPDDSGADHFTTVTYSSVRPGRYMFILFHELMKFKSMGIMFRDDDDVRSYTYVHEARDVARERGFELIEYDGLGPDESLDDCARATRALVDQGAEALFLPSLRCFGSPTADLRPLFEDLYQRNILTFAAEDRDLVRNFALAGLIFSDVPSLARFQTDQIIQILSGTPPGEVGMTMPFHSRILLNMGAAERLGLKLDIKQLAICDEIYLSLPGLTP